MTLSCFRHKARINASVTNSTVFRVKKKRSWITKHCRFSHLVIVHASIEADVPESWLNLSLVTLKRSSVISWIQNPHDSTRKKKKPPYTYLDIYDYKSPVNFNLNSLVCSWSAENLTQPSSITGSCSREYAFLQKVQRDWRPILALLTKDEAITSGTGTVWFRGRLIFYTALMDNFFVHQKPGITSQEMLRSIASKIIFSYID